MRMANAQRDLPNARRLHNLAARLGAGILVLLGPGVVTQVPGQILVQVLVQALASDLPADAVAAPPDSRGSAQVADPATAPVFARIARAWQAGDERALAELVHPDGLRVTGEEAQARAITYSPSQAFYYFKNIFQTGRTISFEFQRHQDPSAGERVHGLALWRRSSPGSQDGTSSKLVFVLIRYQERWMLSEITAIR